MFTINQQSARKYNMKHFIYGITHDNNHFWSFFLCRMYAGIEQINYIYLSSVRIRSIWKIKAYFVMM